MANYKISFIGDKQIKEMHHIGVDYNGNYYSVIFGRYINGGFFSIPNWNCGGELSHFDDVFWNAEYIGNAIDDDKIGEVIAKAIAEFVSVKR